MSEKRFIIVKSIENLYALVDKEREDKEQILILSLHKEQLGVVCDVLNEQQATIEQLQAQLREKEEDERLYANEIVKLNKEAKEVLDFKSLGGDY